MDNDIPNAADLPVSGDAEASASASAAPPLAPPQLDGFQVQRLLGQGGMGTVWSAIQLSTGRTVALKLMRGGAFGSARARTRFDREVELLARLNHPHIARLYHSGTHQGLYFYAMEQVDGQPLHHDLHQHARTPHDLLKLMEKVCRAVDHAHRRGVIHRDLKPGNILVTPDGEPKVVDFGLARLVVDDSADLAHLTAEGAMAGTLAYMSPEQAQGDLARLDTRTDVYSLGVILYELVTGQLPHPAGASPYDLQQRIIHSAPPPPRRVQPRIDRELDTLIRKAMRHEPDQRYATAAALADDLRRYRHGDPLHARPLTLVYVLRKRLAQHKARVAAAALVLLLALSGAGYAYVRIAVERDRAETHARQSEQALYQHRLLLARTEIEQGNVEHAMALLDACPEALRHWEWHYLRRQADASDHTIRVDAGRLAAVAIDAEAGVARAITSVGQLHAWDLSTGERAASAEPAIDAFDRAAFNQAGDALLVYHDDQFELYDARTGEHRQTIPWHGASPVRVAGNHAGSRWAVACRDDQLTVIDAAAGSVGSPIALPDGCTALIFNGDNQLAIAAVNQFAWFDADAEASGPQAWQSLSHAGRRISSLAFHPAGGRLAIGTSVGEIQVWRRGASEPTAHFNVPLDAHLVAIAFTACGDQLIINGENGSLIALHGQTGAPLATLRGHGRRVRWLAVCPTRQAVVSADAWDTLKFWRRASLAGNPTIATVDDPSFRLMHVDHQAGHTYAVGVNSESTRIWRLGDERLELLMTDLPAANAAAFSRAGEQVALTLGRSVEVWNMPTASQPAQRVLRVDAVPPGTLAFSADDRFLLGTSSAAAVVWDVKTGEVVTRLPATALARFDAQKNWLWTQAAGLDQPIVAWDLNTSTPLHEVRLPTAAVRNFAMDPTGSPGMAAATSDGILQLWSTRTPKAGKRWRPYGGATFHQVRFTGDGQRLVTAGPSVKLWNASTGEELLNLELNLPDQFVHAAVDEDNQSIIAGTVNHIVRWSMR